MIAAFPLRWRWPWPAVLAWVLAWALDRALRGAGAGAGASIAAASLAGALPALLARGRRRRMLAAGGYPAALALRWLAGELPASVWLALALLLWLAYPARAWRDAPCFPTPAAALDGLAHRVGLAPRARVLDAGCGAGDALVALRRELPAAALEGLEWSGLWALVARWRCRRIGAVVRRADMWNASWAGCALVYLYQRPESMARAYRKAAAELDDGAWLASLEFAVPGRAPDAVLRDGSTRPVYLYRIGAARQRSTAEASGR